MGIAVTADQQLSVNTTVVIDEAARLESAGYKGNAEEAS